MRWLRAVRALARVEWRQIHRHRGRSLLVAMLIAVPVAAVVGAATIARVITQTPEERARQAMGGATLRIELGSGKPDLAALTALLPPGTPVTAVFAGQETVQIPGRQLRAALLALQPDALEPRGAAAGMVGLQTGRWPADAHEVALSQVLLDGLQSRLGSAVTLAGEEPRLISGVVFVPEDLDVPLVVRPGTAVEQGGKHFALAVVGADDAAALATRLREAGMPVRTRAEASQTGGGLASLAFTAGVIGFLEAALVIAAAFAVGLRRRQHEIGLLGSAGAAAPEITAAMLLSAAGLAVFGGIAGIALGIGAAAALHPYLDAWNGRVNGAFEVAPGDACAAFLLGIGAALLAAWLPVRSATRVPLRESLGACRPTPARSHTGLAAGIACIATGIGLTAIPLPKQEAPAVMLLVGRPILVILGLGICSPSLLAGLARGAAHLPLAWRLALRDTGRFRTRNGPVVTAVLVGMSLTVTAAIIVTSVQSKLDAVPAEFRDDQLLVEGAASEDVARRLQAELHPLAMAPLQAVYEGGEPVRARCGSDKTRRFTRDWVACGDDDLLRAMNAEAGADAMRGGQLLVLDPPAAATGTAGAPAIELASGSEVRALAPEATRAVTLDQKISAPLFVFHRSTLAAMGMEPGPPPGSSVAPYLLRLASPVTPAVLDRARAIAAQSLGASVDAALLHRGPARAIYSVAWAICMLTSLVVVLVATALSAAESAADERVLHTVGAAPALLRRHAAARAGYLALLGCILAVPAGVFTSLALLRAANFQLDPVWPWGDLALIVLSLPAVAYAGVWLFSPAHQLAASVLSFGARSRKYGSTLPVIFTTSGLP